MEIKYDYFENTVLANCINTIRNSVLHHSGKHSCLYIGISSDIETRAKGHARKAVKDIVLPCRGWHSMIVLYKTGGRDKVIKLERSLIRFVRSSGIMAHKCLNRTVGGELPGYYSPYFLYLLLGPKSVRNIYWGVTQL